MGLSTIYGASPPRSVGNAALKPWHTAQANFLLAGYSASLIDSDDGMPLLIATRGAETFSFDSAELAALWLKQTAGGTP